MRIGKFNLNIFKLILGVLISYYFYTAIKAGDLFFNPSVPWALMSKVNLVIHEAGHTIFQSFRDFIHVFMGSGFQVLVPLVFSGYFFFKRQYFSGSILLFWVGHSLIETSIYVGDAQVMILPLLNATGASGSEGSFHDWNYLLDDMGILNKTDQIAHSIYTAGIVCMILAAIGVLIFSFSRRQEEERKWI